MLLRGQFIISANSLQYPTALSEVIQMSVKKCWQISGKRCWFFWGGRCRLHSTQKEKEPRLNCAWTFSEPVQREEQAYLSHLSALRPTNICSCFGFLPQSKWMITGLKQIGLENAPAPWYSLADVRVQCILWSQSVQLSQWVSHTGVRNCTAHKSTFTLIKLCEL